MNVVPLQISNTTYIVSGTIPFETLQGPAINYWVDVQNTAGKTSDSDTYTIGVRPDYPVGGKLELDVVQNELRAVWKTQRHSLLTTAVPAYGTISLLVDGNNVYTSPPQSIQWICTNSCNVTMADLVR